MSLHNNIVYSNKFYAKIRLCKTKTIRVESRLLKLKQEFIYQNCY